ncbi:amino acid adenylation domain-containing protein [Streptomyces sp. NPDC045251]|uniref:amino acid adenylation domain-containing protein n=1 Tax=unclassified Streptomyces TaxID=2593676 RepID=UPI00340AC4C8
MSRARLPLVAGTVERAPARALRRTAEADLATGVLDHVVRHAKSASDRVAVVDGETQLTYRALLCRIGELREALAAQGVGAGDTVAVCGPRSADIPAAFLALESLGASYLPVDPRWPHDRVRDVLGRSRAVRFLYDAREPGGEDAVRAALAEQVKVLELPASTGSGTPPPRTVADRSLEARYTIFTSGTTGRPKGATVEHQGMVNHLRAKIEDLSITADDVVAFTAPLVFDISIWQMLCPLMAGGRLVVVRDETLRFPRRLVNALRSAGATVVELVPTVVGWIVDETLRRGGEALPDLRCLISTGEELRPAVAARTLDALPRTVLVNAYGPTECSDDVTHHTVTREDTSRPRLPVGAPIANTSLYLLVDEGDAGWRAAEPGEIGELFVGGTGVGLGYLNDQETTDRAFFADPFDPESATGRLYRTGDLARFENGLVHYLGRSDRQVKVAGVRMELDEIEAVLSRLPAVRACAVTVAGAGERSELVAHYALHSPAGSGELQEILRASVPAAMVPRRWRQWEDLPLTPNGKVDHRTLRAAVDREGTS